MPQIPFTPKLFWANKERAKHIRSRKVSAGFYISLYSAEAFRGSLPAAVVSGAEKQHLTAFSSPFFSLRRELLLFTLIPQPKQRLGPTLLPEKRQPRGFPALAGLGRGCASVTLFLLPAPQEPGAAAASAGTATPSALSIPRLKLTVTTEITRSIWLLFAAAQFSPWLRLGKLLYSGNNCAATVLPCSWGRAKPTGQLLEAQGIIKRQTINGISYSSLTR